MPSIVDICNLALQQIGSTEIVQDIENATSTQEKVLKVAFPQARDSALAATNWPFCLRRAALALTETDPSPEWHYRYQLPADCVAARYLETPIRRAFVPKDMREPFIIESSEDGLGLSLMTDLVDAVLCYTTNRQGVGTWPPMFTRLIVRVLACDIAMPIAKDQRIADRAEAAAYRAFMNARAFVFNEQTHDPEQDPESIQARD